MKCLQKYQWVKLPRDYPDMGKGLMGYWVKLASRAAFRKGKAIYCGHTNLVTPGMWSGGIVGLKSILGVKSRAKAFAVIEQLSSIGYLIYHLDTQTKKLTYEIVDWVLKGSGAECVSGAVYATQGFGFLCMPRTITQRLIDAGRVFQEADAWLDLWCHTTFEDYGNAFSFLAPVIQYGKYGSILTLETLGKRWGWEKTKVWRFFKKHRSIFALQRLPSSYGCLIFNLLYPTGADVQLPSEAVTVQLMNQLLASSHYRYKGNSENLKLNHMVAWYSRIVLSSRNSTMNETEKDRVVLPSPITRAYFSHGRNCKHNRNCHYACQGVLREDTDFFVFAYQIRGPCTKPGHQRNNFNNWRNHQ